MRLGRLLIILAVVLFLVLAGAFAFFQTISQEREGLVDGEIPTLILTQIIIAEQPIPRGGFITEDALGTIGIPPEDVIPDVMFTELDEVTGYRARFDINPGVPLTAGMVVKDLEGISDTGSDIALLIPRGMVAITIPVDRFSTIAYGLRRGDHINLLAAFQFVDLDTEFQSQLPNASGAVIPPGAHYLMGADERDPETGAVIGGSATFVEGTEGEEGGEANWTNLVAQTINGGIVSIQGRTEVDPVLNQPFYLLPLEPQRPRTVVQTILQDIVVLQVGNLPIEDKEIVTPSTTPENQQPQAPGEDGEQAPPPPPTPPNIVVLIVTPQDAITLNYLMLLQIKMNMVLRASGDDTRIFTEAVTLQYLLDSYNIPIPAKLPYGFHPRVDELLTSTEGRLRDLQAASDQQ